MNNQQRACSPVSDRNDLTDLIQKDFRDEYMSTLVRAGICYQIQALREQLDLNQTDFAQKVGKLQSTISRLENVEHNRASVQTLLDIACAMNIALVVKFVSYPTFLDFMKDMSPDGLRVETFADSLNQQSISAGARRIDLSSSVALSARAGSAPAVHADAGSSSRPGVRTWQTDRRETLTNRLVLGQNITGKSIVMGSTSGLVPLISA